MSKQPTKTVNRPPTNKRHSKWMLENNPTRETIWVNNGIKNLRVKSDNIPEGFEKGRMPGFTLERKLHVCPHCDKEGYGPNMKRYHFDNCKHKDEKKKKSKKNSKN